MAKHPTHFVSLFFLFSFHYYFDFHFLEFFFIELKFDSQFLSAFFFSFCQLNKKKFNLKFLFVLFLLFSVAFRPEELAHSTRRAEMADRGEAHARGRRPSLPRIRIPN